MGERLGSSSVVDYGIWMVGIIAVICGALLFQAILTDYSTAYNINTGGRQIIVGDTYDKVSNITKEMNDQMTISGQSSESFTTKMVSAAWSSMKLLASMPGILAGFIVGIFQNIPSTVANINIVTYILTGIIVIFVFTLVWSTFFGIRPR